MDKGELSPEQALQQQLKCDVTRIAGQLKMCRDAKKSLSLADTDHGPLSVSHNQVLEVLAAQEQDLECQFEQARQHVKDQQPADKRLQPVGQQVHETQGKLAKTESELEAVEGTIAKALKQKARLEEQKQIQQAKERRGRVACQGGHQ
jgi:hypothetical protein